MACRYQLVNGELIIAEDEAEIIRIIYDKYDKKYNDMQERLDKLYDEIKDIENAMEEVIFEESPV